jgi:hypothetical protein
MYVQFLSVVCFTDLVYCAWKKLLILPQKRLSQTELHRVIRSTLHTYLSNKRVGNLLANELTQLYVTYAFACSFISMTHWSYI